MRMNTSVSSVLRRARCVLRGDLGELVQGGQEQVVARADGAAQRFVAVYDEYRLARDVTKQRIYLETMESIFNGAQKVIIDNASGGSGVVPYLPLPELKKRQEDAQ